MTILTFISLTGFVIVATLLIAACIKADTNLALSAACIIIIWLLVHAVFQIGAKWQAGYTKDNYILIPISKVCPSP